LQRETKKWGGRDGTDSLGKAISLDLGILISPAWRSSLQTEISGFFYGTRGIKLLSPRRLQTWGNAKQKKKE